MVPLFSFLKGLVHLFFPASCPVCGALGEVLCAACGDELLSSSGTSSIALCGGAVEVLYGGVHEGVLRDVVHLFKYRGWRSLAFHAGVAMGRRFSPLGACLVPVPLHRDSRRGYNQALSLAEGLSSVWGFPVEDRLIWRARVVSQVKSKDRLVPKGAMGWSGHGGRKGVVLVDDVLTTGGTLRAAAEALRGAGCSVAGVVVLSLSSAFEGGRTGGSLSSSV
ncbi:MAG: phosphoribosyltransferase family protein [Thermanaerothrix sp.]|nr:phosphoribosyltransferase family protein [Thermanaerothrix sp.]